MSAFAVVTHKSRLLFFVLLLIVASFSNAAAQEGGVVLRVSTWNQGGFIGENYERFADEFIAQHPEVERIEAEFQPFARYHDVLNVQLAAGDPPDLAWLNILFGPAYMQAGQLLELGGPLGALEGYEFEDFNPQALAPWTLEGNIYGIPFTNSTNVMYVNLDIFEAAGLPNPEETIANDEWTWEYLQQASKQIVDSGAGRYGFVFANDIYGNGWRILEDILAPYGAQPWSEDGLTCMFNTPEFIEAVSLVHEMIFVDGSHPEPGAQVDFFAGDVGMALARPSRAPSLEGVPYQWTVVRAPSGPAGYRPTVGHAALVVFADGENTDLAIEFLAYITNPENSVAMSNAFPSARLSTQTVELLASVNPILSEAQIADAIIPAISSPDASWSYSHRYWGPVADNSQLVFDTEVWIPEADVATAMQNVCSNIEPLLG